MGSRKWPNLRAMERFGWPVLSGIGKFDYCVCADDPFSSVRRRSVREDEILRGYKLYFILARMWTQKAISIGRDRDRESMAVDAGRICRVWLGWSEESENNKRFIFESKLTNGPSSGCGMLFIRLEACRSGRWGGGITVVVGGAGVAIGTSVPSCKTRGKEICGFNIGRIDFTLSDLIGTEGGGDI